MATILRFFMALLMEVRILTNIVKLLVLMHNYGKNEYEGPESFDGRWGIFDEEFLQYFSQKLTSFKQPFFSTIFTISSHNPYTIPEKFKGKFPKGKTKILKV